MSSLDDSTRCGSPGGRVSTVIIISVSGEARAADLHFVLQYGIRQSHTTLLGEEDVGAESVRGQS